MYYYHYYYYHYYYYYMYIFLRPISLRHVLRSDLPSARLLGCPVILNNALKIGSQTRGWTKQTSDLSRALFGCAAERIPQIPKPLEIPQALAFQNRALHNTTKHCVRKRPKSERGSTNLSHPAATRRGAWYDHGVRLQTAGTPRPKPGWGVPVSQLNKLMACLRVDPSASPCHFRPRPQS